MKAWIIILILAVAVAFTEGQTSKTPINNGILQSDLNAAGYKITNANLVDYAGSGMTWNAVTGKFDAAGGSGAPGGSTTQFQYNNAGAFGGIPSVTYDGTIPVTISKDGGSNTRFTGIKLINPTTSTINTEGRQAPAIHLIENLRTGGVTHTYDHMIWGEGGNLLFGTSIDGSVVGGTGHAIIGFDAAGNIIPASGDQQLTFAVLYGLDWVAAGGDASHPQKVAMLAYGYLGVNGLMMGNDALVNWDAGSVWANAEGDTNLRRSAAGVVKVKSAIELTPVAVSALPTGVLGRMAVVNDGTASLGWGATVTGGGSTKYAVWYNGTNWTVTGDGTGGGGVAWGAITGTLSAQTDLNTALAGKVNDTGDTMTGDFSIAKADPTLFLDKTVANEGAIQLRTGSLSRWKIFSDTTAEGGANAGSHFRIARFNDAGTLIDNALSLNRTTGALSTNAITALGAITAPAGAAATCSVNWGTVNTGIYGTTNTTSFAITGVPRFAIGASTITATAPIQVPASGTAAASQLHFGTAGTGFYGDTTSISATTGGTNRLTLNSTAAAFTVPVDTTGITIGGAAATGKILIGDGTKFAASTPTWPTAAGTVGYLVRSDGTNFTSYPNQQTNSSVTNQSFTTSDTYLTNSNCVVAAGDFKAKGQYRCVFDMVKSAGTGAIVITVRIGTAGTTSDPGKLTFTFGAGTSVADTGVFDVVVNWRTVGSGTSAVVQGICRGTHNLATTGLFNNAAGWVIVGTPSGGFDSSTATTIGLSVNGSTAFAATNSLTQAQLQQ